MDLFQLQAVSVEDRIVDFEASMPIKTPDDHQRKCNEPLPIIIDLSRVTDIDFTAAVVITSITTHFIMHNSMLES